MMKSGSGHDQRHRAETSNLSADAQINKCEVAKDSSAFHNLTGAIAAYGKVQALLAALQQRENSYKIVGQCEFSECVAAVR